MSDLPNSCWIAYGICREATCRGWESHFPHQMGLASISLMWDQRPGSICAANSYFFPLAQLDRSCASEVRAAPDDYWRQKAAAASTACDLLMESYCITHPRVNTSIIICPCSLLLRVSSHSRWPPKDCYISCYPSPVQPWQSLLIAHVLPGAMPSVLLPSKSSGEKRAMNFATVGQLSTDPNLDVMISCEHTSSLGIWISVMILMVYSYFFFPCYCGKSVSMWRTCMYILNLAVQKFSLWLLLSTWCLYRCSELLGIEFEPH